MIRFPSLLPFRDFILVFAGALVGLVGIIVEEFFVSSKERALSRRQAEEQIVLETRIKNLNEERDVYLLESKDFIQAILNDKETRTSIQEGAKTLEFTLAARKSMESGKPVKLPLT